MHIIDDIRFRANLAHIVATAPLARDVRDPIVFLSPEADVWRFGMVESMWQYHVEQSAAELFERRIWF